VFTDGEWLRVQLDFQTRHQYFTPQAQALLGRQKAANMRRLAVLAGECVADA
jgi:hypothetical protein